MKEPRDIVDIPGLGARPPTHAQLETTHAQLGTTHAQPGSTHARSGTTRGEPAADAGATKPFLMIWFRCCATYARLPKSADGLRYEGRCPRCLAHLEVPIGQGGTNRRMFEAS